MEHDAPSLSALRRAEFETLQSMLPSEVRNRPGTLVEIGGADGFVSGLWNAEGWSVRSFDPAPRLPIDASCVPVEYFDGRTLSIPSNSVDLVFSSHVLEHVEQLEALHQEIARILKPSGLALHVMPTHTWRAWSLIAHYPGLVQRAVSRLTGRRTGSLGADTRSDEIPVRNDTSPVRSESFMSSKIVKPLKRRMTWICGVLTPTPHGTGRSALAEIATFHPREWRNRFQAAEWTILQSRNLNVFYTGVGLFGRRLSVRRRVILARMLGSSSFAYLVMHTRNRNVQGRPEKQPDSAVGARRALTSQS